MVFKLFAYSLAFIGLSFGCANHKELVQDSVQNEVSFNITSSTPHCGGMAPMPGVEYPVQAPMSNYTLVIFSVDEKGNRKDKIGTITTDEEGNASMQLPAGNFELWRPDKLLSIEEFMAANKKAKGDDYVYANESCFEKWKNTPDGQFSSTQGTVSVVYKRKCYVGDNPCMEYKGPAAP